ncbi:sensor histidine kinase [Romboutsia sp. 13368]|uniref:sensor histidine kinase n=1 Tax=Romboutsia sp. 13368 TaxID=2708053 RepID=UPI0025D46158|nr:HAMP domain-containing sensor histidine kinase [Romboutsia sp. 13368]
MSIKNKLWLVIISSFMINCMVMLGYYKYNLHEKIENEINIKREQIDKDLNYLSNEIEKKESLENIEDIILNLEKKNSINIKIENINDDLIYEYTTQNNAYLNLTAVDLVKVNDDIYMITINFPIKINELTKIPILKDVLRIEIIIITITLILLSIILYQSIIKPILHLQKDIENYKFGIKPIKINRRDEIGWLKNNFFELTEKLDKEKQNQNRIIASISHDIKTPLTSILGYSERLQNKNMPEERKDRYIEIIYSKAQDIKELMYEFDEYLGNNLDSGINKEDICIKDLCDLINKEYKDELTYMDIEFEVNSNCDDEVLNIDISKLRRVFGNIIGNSIKNMKEHKKLIKIDFENIKDEIMISISDSGCGVDESDTEKIFEALYTSDKSRKVAGLGLSICKSIVKSHKGKIYAKNNSMGGLSIIIVLNKAVKVNSK